MKVHTNHRIIAPQAAIDTVCEHCGGIFDLNDGVINCTGKILCPECITLEYPTKDSQRKQDAKKINIESLHVQPLHRHG